MPFGSEGIDPQLIGLALSGGGFRATLFHLGTLWRLNELGYLPKLDRISSVSGGSIGAQPETVRQHRPGGETPVSAGIRFGYVRSKSKQLFGRDKSDARSRERLVPRRCRA